MSKVRNFILVNLCLIGILTVSRLEGQFVTNSIRPKWNPFHRQEPVIVQKNFLQFLKNGAQFQSSPYSQSEDHQQFDGYLRNVNSEPSIYTDSIKPSQTNDGFDKTWNNLVGMEQNFQRIPSSLFELNPQFLDLLSPVTSSTKMEEPEPIPDTDHIEIRKLIHDNPKLHGTIEGLILFLGYRAAQTLNRLQENWNIPLDLKHSPANENENENIWSWFLEFLAMSKKTEIQSEIVKNQSEDHRQEYNKRVFEMAEEFLKDNPDIQAYITSAMSDHEMDQHFEEKKSLKNSHVNLSLFKDEIPNWNKNEKKSWSIRNSSNYRIFCGNRKENAANKTKSRFGSLKLCQNILGLFKSGKNNGSIYFDLDDGHDSAIGRRGYPNIFLVKKGQKFFKGQDQSDTFILEETGIKGILNGGPDNDNSLIIGQSFEEMGTVVVNFTRGQGRLKQSDGSILVTKNVQIIHGRVKQPDKFFIDSSSKVKFINGHGGGSSSDHSDIIEIVDSKQCSVLKPESNCDSKDYTNLQIAVSPFTKIYNHATFGNFTYIFSPDSSSGIELQINSNKFALHKVLLNFSLTKISSIKCQLEDSVGILTIEANEFGFSLPIPFTIKLNDNQNDYPQELEQQPKFYTLFQDGHTTEAEIQISVSGQIIVIHQLDLDRASLISNETQTTNYKGFQSAINVFNIHKGNWNIFGSDSTNVFKIHSKFKGNLDGGFQSENSLILQDDSFNANEQIIEINLMEQFLAYEDQNQVIKIGLKNIQNVVGRFDAPDLITINCGTTHVDARGGYRSQKLNGIHVNGTRKVADVIVIPPNNKYDALNKCLFYSTSVIINTATVVKNSAISGQFNYHIKKLGIFDVEMDHFEGNIIHNYILAYNFDTIKSVIFDRGNNRLNFKFNISTDRNYDLSHRLIFRSLDFYHVAPNIFTQDEIQLKVIKDNGDIIAFVQLDYENYVNDLRGLNRIQHTIKLINIPSTQRNFCVFGGDQKDLVILGQANLDYTQSRHMGSVDGLEGQNWLKIDNNFLQGHHLRVNLFRQRILTQNSKSKFRMKVSNFSFIEGRREGNETIVVGCQTKFVSGLGGHDLIIVPPGLLSSCSNKDQQEEVKMKFVIGMSTRVLNFAPRGTFIYQIENQRLDSFNVERVDFASLNSTNVQHIYQLRIKLDEITKAWFEVDSTEQTSLNGKVCLRVQTNRLFQYQVRLEKESENDQFYETKPKLLILNGLRIVINSQTGAIEYKKQDEIILE